MSAPNQQIKCPDEWEYRNHPNYSEETIKDRWAFALVQYRAMCPLRQKEVIKDTRDFHNALFHDLTPAGFPWFAGHYRGEDLPCLDGWHVHVASDPRVGHKPHVVLYSMRKDSQQVEKAVSELDFVATNPQWYDRRLLSLRVVKLAAAILVRFLEVHPYANGNGHAARNIVNALMGRYGFWMARFPVHVRPDPNYGKLISLYRDGQTRPLEMFIINCI